MLANLKKQDLAEHCFATGMLALYMFNYFFNEDKYKELLNNLDIEDSLFDIEKIKNTIMNVGCYHDLGKADGKFQAYINSKSGFNIENNEVDIQIESNNKKDKYTPEEYPLHQEISWALCSSAMIKNIKAYHEGLFLYGVYWHHAKLLRKNKDDFLSATKILENKNLNITELFESAKIVNEKIIKLSENYGEKVDFYVDFEEDSLSELREKATSKTIPAFQSSAFLEKGNDKVEFLKNALMHMIRSLVVSADRIISSLTGEELKDIIESKDIKSLLCKIKENDFPLLNIGIENMLEGFTAKYGHSERSKAQEKTVSELNNVEDIAVLYGPAGVGKTKMMLDWLKRKENNKKTFIIVPKSSIAYSLYKEISREYLPANHIEIITGDFKETSKNNQCYTTPEEMLFAGEINITTIDQILNMMLSHNKIDIFLEVLSSNIIFDEYHEFMDIPGIIILFIQMIFLKRFMNNGACLLVSATPNYFLLKEKLFIRSENNIKKINSFNTTHYHININEFKDERSVSEIHNRMFDNIQQGEIALFNSATKAQVSAISAIKKQEKNTLVYHSKFFNNDKKAIFENIMQEFRKGGTRRFAVRVGPILQASVDISTKHMYTEISTIDNIYQRLGRVVRWSESEEGYYSIFIPQDMTKKDSINAGLSSLGNYHATVKFTEFFKEKLKDKKIWTLNELYPLYTEFFKDRKVKEAYEADWKEIIQFSRKIFDQGFEPVKMLIINTKKNETKVMSKKSLRGKSIFGIACTINYSDNKEILTEPTEELNNSMFSLDKNSFHGDIEKNNILEENREQISKYFNNKVHLREIEKAIKEKSFVGKNKFSKIPVHWFLDFARNESTPLIFSFADPLIKMNSSEQRFNVIYEGVKMGIMNNSLFVKIK